jgi:hypothetical protein
MTPDNGRDFVETSELLNCGRCLMDVIAFLPKGPRLAPLGLCLKTEVHFKSA